jgi:hypothetical protein
MGPSVATIDRVVPYPVQVHIPGQTDALRECALELEIDVVLSTRGNSPSLLVGHSPEGQRWLVARMVGGPAGCRWACASHSELAIRCVRTGRAAPADLFRHSGSGTVVIIDATADGGVSESVRLCAEVTDEELGFS